MWRQVGQGGQVELRQRVERFAVGIKWRLRFVGAAEIDAANPVFLFAVAWPHAAGCEGGAESGEFGADVVEEERVEHFEDVGQDRKSTV